MLSSTNTGATQSSIVEFPPVGTISGSLVAYWDELSKPHPESTSHSSPRAPLPAGRWLALEYLYNTVNTL